MPDRSDRAVLERAVREGDPAHAAKAMDLVLSKLVDMDARIIRLFTPPANLGQGSRLHQGLSARRVRENGGQYTHAATWVVALA